MAPFDSSEQLIRTKLHLPFLRSGLIARPRLHAQILQGLRGPLTLITAPAGFGKTTLVASCLAGCGMPVAWLSLDKNDNRTGRFICYLVAALNGIDGALAGEAAALLASSPPAPKEAILTSLINELDSCGTDLVLVLDDYHVITSQTVQEAVAFLLEHPPRNLHLVIASRSDPALPLARLRARAQTVELRAADLRFTLDEVTEFLGDVTGLRLDSASVAVLEERTEGWIAGLQMAALSMRDRKDIDGFIAGFSGTQRYVLDYLLEEILNVQPPEVQQFLLRTSILDRLSASLCDALLADAEHAASLGPSAAEPMLNHLERANLFLVPLDDERTWYRYHHLFADLLRARLDQLHPGLSPVLHARAAAWLDQAGMTVEAVNHTLSAGDYDGAARLVEENSTRLLAQGELNALMSWIDILPAELRTARPWLCIHQAYALLFAGRSAEVGPLLDQAESTLAAHGSEARAIMGAIAAVRAFAAAILVQDEEALAQARQAATLLDPGDLFDQALVAFARGYALHSQGHLPEARSAYEDQIRLSRLMQNDAALMIGVTALARVLGDQGYVPQTRALLEQALADARKAGARHAGFIARLQAHLAAMLYEQNELQAARGLLSDALSHARFWLNPNHLATLQIFLTRVLFAQGDLPGARAAVEEADRIRRTAPLSNWMRRSLELDIVSVWLAFQSAGRALVPGDPLAEQSALIIASWRRELSGPPPGPEALFSQFDELPRLGLARVALNAGQLDEAVAWLEPLIRSAKAAGHGGAAIYSLVLMAVALQGKHNGRTLPALAALEEALTLAEPGGYVRVFLNEGRPIKLLLAQWLADASPGALRDYAAFLLSQFNAQAPSLAAPDQKASVSGVLIEPLSQRELEVLQLLAMGKTNQDIAQQLIVAPGTIKAHASSIYRKLDVRNRTEAVTRARLLGLLG